MGKLEKALQNPTGFLADSRYRLLSKTGRRLESYQRKRYQQLGATAPDIRIGVIMTAYNTANLIAAAVASMQAQTHQCFELWIIDDASTDNTAQVLRVLGSSDDRIRAFRSPVNHGTYWSKNWCLKHIKTPIVTFHDSDDRSSPDRLRQQLGALLAHRRALATVARWCRVTPQGERMRISGQIDRLAAITLMMHRERACQEVGFFDTVRISADTEYLSRIRHKLGRKAIIADRDILYYALLRDQSLTRGDGSGFVWKGDEANQERVLSGDRLRYHDNFKSWHRGPNGYEALPVVDFPGTGRPFDAPRSLLKNCDDQKLDGVYPI